MPQKPYISQHFYYQAHQYAKEAPEDLLRWNLGGHQIFPKLEEELLGLQYDTRKNKIDHRPNGSKDLADALAGAVYHCSRRTPWNGRGHDAE